MVKLHFAGQETFPIRLPVEGKGGESWRESAISVAAIIGTGCLLGAGLDVAPSYCFIEPVLWISQIEFQPDNLLEIVG